jgi:hypothetical protein
MQHDEVAVAEGETRQAPHPLRAPPRFPARAAHNRFRRSRHANPSGARLGKRPGAPGACPAGPPVPRRARVARLAVPEALMLGRSLPIPDWGSAAMCCDPDIGRVNGASELSDRTRCSCACSTDALQQADLGPRMRRQGPVPGNGSRHVGKRTRVGQVRRRAPPPPCGRGRPVICGVRSFAAIAAPGGVVRALWEELRFRPPYSPSIGRAGQLGEDRRAPSARKPGRLKPANGWSLVSRLWRIAGSSPSDVPGRSRGTPPVRTGE